MILNGEKAKKKRKWKKEGKEEEKMHGKCKKQSV